MTDITGVILTFNEAPNIERTLSRLTWLKDIVIVDSLSSDETVAIASRFANVRVFRRAFTTHAEQWNYALEHTGISSEWVLALDADYVLTDALIREIQALQPDPQSVGFAASFDYCVDGTPLRGGVYPPVTVLYRRAAGRYEQDGHTQRVRLRGTVRPLVGRIRHDDRKSIAHWLGAQARYMQLEAEKLMTAGAPVGTADAVRRWIVIAPPAMFLYSYLVRGGIFDGRAGLFYALQRTVSELILSLFLVRRKLAGRPE
ncbi:MAG TPA: glycosyltransferase family 2 protein [Vicinamibacterales bacterium]|nr:glycosyltransferase family 2 protein [Vicinamibacterales bacterium]